MGKWLYHRASGGITGDSITFEQADSDRNNILSESELSALTVAQIKAIAKEKGYTILATKKADIIAEFLEQQNG